MQRDVDRSCVDGDYLNGAGLEYTMGRGGDSIGGWVWKVRKTANEQRRAGGS